jgi:REP element-mobilizing transposase RayT
MPNYHIPVFPDKFYHFFSRAVGSEKLFKEEENYRYFLEKMNEHLTSVCEIWAYCLIPNHFHLLVRIKPEIDIWLAFESKKKLKEFHQDLVSNFVLEQFSNFLNSYTKSINKRYKRKGGLFMNYLRRVEIAKDSQLTSALFYVHKNPVHHGLVKQIGSWKWSSYLSFLSDRPTKLEREYVLDWFGGKEGFLKFHSQPIERKGLDELE